jgi:hypothetical protein
LKPSSQPSAATSVQPSFQPTTNPPFSYQPSLSAQPSSQPISTSLITSNNLVNSDGKSTISPFGLWLMISLVGVVVCFLVLGRFGCFCKERKRRRY